MKGQMEIYRIKAQTEMHLNFHWSSAEELSCNKGKPDDDEQETQIMEDATAGMSYYLRLIL
jgi:hypothetical protein